MTHQIVTANRLADGRVVYLTQDAHWSARVADSRPANGAAAALLMTAAEISVANRIVIDPYLIDVTLEAGLPRPVLHRERIRATGPTEVETSPSREVA